MRQNYKQKIMRQAKAVEEYHQVNTGMDAKDVLIALYRGYTEVLEERLGELNE